MIRLRQRGVTFERIAQATGCTVSTVRRHVTGVTWKKADATKRLESISSSDAASGEHERANTA